MWYNKSFSSAWEMVEFLNTEGLVLADVKEIEVIDGQWNVTWFA